MKLSLVVMTEGKSKGQIIPITLTQFVIGRDPQCNLRPASPLISKRHCAVVQKFGKVYVNDFNSTNGTFINDVQVKGEKELLNGDQLKLGPLIFKVSIESSIAVNKPTPIPVKAGDVSDDDSVAAMLLSLQDESAEGKSGAESSDDIPSGSTVMDMIHPPAKEPETAQEAKPDDKQPGKPAAQKVDAKQQQANTSLAAKAILEKYTRRQR